MGLASGAGQAGLFSPVVGGHAIRRVTVTWSSG